MRKTGRAMLVIGLLASIVGVARAQTFELGFDGPGVMIGPAGSTQIGICTATLTHNGPAPGARGWSFGVTADNALITAITIHGTAAAALLNPDSHFERTELTVGPGNEGAVTAVVLDLANPVTLPISTTSSVALLEVAATIPPGGGVATVRYQDGLQGSGQPIGCTVTQNDRSHDPIKNTKNILLEEIPPVFTLDFDGAGTLSGPAGSSQTGTCTATLTHAGPGTGAQGYSFGVVADNALITDITIDGTDAAALLNPDALLHFAFSELTFGPGNEGAVAAVVLDFENPVTLPTGATSTVAILEVTATIPPGGGVATIRYQEDLQGSGQPVACVVSQNGMSRDPIKNSKSVVLGVLDSDGDGLPDDEDECPASDVRTTVAIDGRNTGVPNSFFDSGCTFSDEIERLAASATDHGDFVSSVSALAGALKKAGWISGSEKGAIVSAAARADTP